jgi:hypothetical protein
MIGAAMAATLTAIATAPGQCVYPAVCVPPHKALHSTIASVQSRSQWEDDDGYCGSLSVQASGGCVRVCAGVCVRADACGCRTRTRTQMRNPLVEHLFFSFLAKARCCQASKLLTVLATPLLCVLLAGDRHELRKLDLTGPGPKGCYPWYARMPQTRTSVGEPSCFSVVVSGCIAKRKPTLSE